MKQKSPLVLVFLLAVLSVSFSSCEAIADIFKAGMWFGIIGVIVVVALIIWLINKMRK